MALPRGEVAEKKKYLRTLPVQDCDEGHWQEER